MHYDDDGNEACTVSDSAGTPDTSEGFAVGAWPSTGKASSGLVSLALGTAAAIGVGVFVPVSGCTPLGVLPLRAGRRRAVTTISWISSSGAAGAGFAG